MSRSRVIPSVLAAALAILGLAPQQQPPPLVERVEVSRVLVDARVVDGPGHPILGLGLDDFHVKIDGKAARVESVQWVAGRAEDTNGLLDSTSTRGVVALPPEGRLIVLLFQKSLHRSRIFGLMRMLIKVRGFLDTFTPNDRVAVLSFDSHLRVWLDFTNDLHRVRPILERGILFQRPGPVHAALPPSLVAGLDPARARRASTIEEGLRLIAEALEPLPGSKSIVFVGHGFGELGTGINMVRYEKSRQALQTARVSVFSLDVTDADYHSLEAGLQIVANDTGGFFARTHIFTERALTRLSGALAGYYVLFVEKPDLERGTHRIEVDLTRATGTVMARRGFVD